MVSYDALLIDAGTGNLHSVYNALLSQGFSIKITTNPKDLAESNRIILPGVGAFKSFMDGLHNQDLAVPLQRAAKRGDLLLGICVGMQALFEISEEMGERPGLDLLSGRVFRFPDKKGLKVPHTGWNQLWHQKMSPIFTDIPSGSYAYFNHSYYSAPNDHNDISAQTDYGIEFTSAIQHDNLYGVQFHPEKSQRIGLKVLENFLKL
jgi:glutamine amidotransferase